MFRYKVRQRSKEKTSIPSKGIGFLKMLALLFSGLVLLISNSCQDCGESLDLGQFSLDQQSIDDWHPYNFGGYDTLVFVDSANNQLVLAGEVKYLELTQHIYRVICSSDLGWEQDQNEFWHGDQYSLHLEAVSAPANEMYSILIYLWVDGTEYTHPISDPSEGLLLFDVFQIETYARVTIDPVESALRMIVNNKGNNIDTVNSYYAGLNDIEFSQSIVLNGHTFNDVWHNAQSNPFEGKIYIQKGKGLIALTGADRRLWVIKD